MKNLHILQKIGLIGLTATPFISLVLYFLDHFSPYFFTLLMPFCVAILIGYSANISKQNTK